ncbi:unnamed protein product [Pleuronectes platessa]|uniref:Uncharacterized protein n=1 Tax=Pleuronectes platessa TaxID=8262 RepID=A0A9N7YM16_PLEPL|nr:unnamed protein product [Pleuronectes platessa]
MRIIHASVNTYFLNSCALLSRFTQTKQNDPLSPSVPAWPLSPCVPAWPLSPSVPAWPLSPCVPAWPLSPSVPAWPLSPCVPAWPLSPSVPAWPLSPCVLLYPGSSCQALMTFVTEHPGSGSQCRAASTARPLTLFPRVLRDQMGEGRGRGEHSAAFSRWVGNQTSVFVESIIDQDALVPALSLSTTLTLSLLPSCLPLIPPPLQNTYTAPHSASRPLRGEVFNWAQGIKMSLFTLQPLNLQLHTGHVVLFCDEVCTRLSHHPMSISPRHNWDVWSLTRFDEDNHTYQ